MKTNYLKSLLVLVCLFCNLGFMYAQSFNNAYGLTGNDEFRTILPIAGGDYLVAGTAATNGGDMYIARISQTGTKVWERTLGGTGVEIATVSTYNQNGNALIAGTTTSLTTTNTSSDILVVEIDINGNVQWVKDIGRNNNLNDGPNGINLTANGIGICGYSVVVGSSSPDLLAVEITNDGSAINWQRSYNNNSFNGDIGYQLISSSLGGYIIIGGINGGNGSYDQLLLRVNANGTIISSLLYGSTLDENAHRIVELANGDVVIMGNYRSLSGASLELSLTRINSSNAIQWSRTYGDNGTSNERAFGFVQTDAGGYALAGYTGLGLGVNDFLLVETDETGIMTNSFAVGRAANDHPYALVQNSDNGYTIAGFTSSFGAGGTDGYLIRATPNGVVPNNCSSANVIERAVTPSVNNNIVLAATSATVALNTPTFIANTTIQLALSTPPNLTINGVDEICLNNSSTFTSAPAGVPVTWSISGGTATITTQTGSNCTVNFNTQGVVTLKATYGTCEVTKQITVGPMPVVSITGLDATYCSGVPAITLTGAPTGGTFTVNGTPSTVLSTATAGTYLVGYSAAVSGCTGSTTQSVTILPKPTVSIVGLNASYCIGVPDITLVGSPAGGTFTVNGNPATSLSASTAGTFIVKYDYSDITNGCSNSLVQTVVINPLPEVAITNLNNSYCSGYYTVALAGTPVGGIFTINGTLQTVFEPSIVGTYTIVYSYTNENGCSNTDTKIVEVTDCCKYKIGDLTSTCGSTSTTCVPLVATMPVDKGIIGMDYCLKYDPAVMVPTGKYTLGNLVTQGNANWATAYLNTTTSGTVRASIHYTTAAPAGTLFKGSGNVICIEFKLLAGAPIGMHSFTACELEEAYKLTEKSACWAPGTISVAYTDVLKGTLIYQGNTSKKIGMSYAVTNPNMAVTKIVGVDANCVATTPVVQPTASGNFDLSFGNATKFSITRDINTLPGTSAYATLKYINGYDTYLMQNIATKKTTGSHVVPTTAYMMIAADVNMNDKVRANDITLVQERIVKKIAEYPQTWNSLPSPYSPSLDWRFIDKYTVDNDVSFKRSATFPESDGIGFFRDDVPNVPFCLPIKGQCLGDARAFYSGILLGDLFDGGPGVFAPNSKYPNGSDPYIRVATNEETNTPVTFEVDDVVALEENVYRVFVKHTLNEKDSLVSFDFGLTYNKDEISVLDLKGSAETFDSNISMMWNLTNESEVVVTSFATNGYPVKGNLFYLDIFKPSGKPVAADFNNSFAFLNGVESGASVKLKSTKTDGTSTVNGLMENAVSIQPNPASESAVIRYSFNSFATAKIEVLNSLGQEVSSFEGLSNEGSVSLDVRNLSKGVYHCVVTEGSNKIVKKLIVY